MKRILLFICCLIGTTGANCFGQQDKDISLIQYRLLCMARIEKTAIEVSMPVDELLKTMKDDGGWPDIDYLDKPKVNLPAIEHLSRLIQMAILLKDSNSIYSDKTKLSPAILKGIAYWVAKNPQSQNWWYNVIGTPTELAKLLLLMDDELTDTLRSVYVKPLMIANKDGRLMTGKSEATGQNMIWIARLQVVAACLLRSGEYLQFAVDKLAGEMKISEGEGIQPDLSFHQHGPQLYSGGYGLGFAVDCAKAIYVLHGTKYSIPSSAVQVIDQYLREGLPWMIYADKIDYATMGREIARKDKSALPLVSAYEYMSMADAANMNEYVRLAQSIALQKANINEGIRGNRYFWRSDYLSHIRDFFFCSLKMSSTRTISSESGNGEAEKNYHIGDGSMFMMRTGKEYENIFPLWDWQKVPGVTCRLRTDALPLINFGYNARGKTEFVGAASGGKYSVAAMDYNKDSVRAHKAWFFFDKEIVCLGAGIHGELSNEIVTTVNQSFVKGTIQYYSNIQQSTLTDSLTKNVEAVYANNIAYFFEKGSDARLQQQQRNADWRSINRYLLHDDTVSGKVFTLWVSHGRQPKQSSYAYAIVPGIPVKEVAMYQKDKQWKILSNTTKLQAVVHPVDGIYEAVFYQPGEIKLSQQISISVDQRCMLLLKETLDSVYVSVSSPEGKMVGVQVSIREGNRNRLWSKMLFETNGAMTGQTVTRALRWPAKK